jgi:cilia- and flagella-associated protein 69
MLSESGILLALLSFIKPVQIDRDPRDWTISQFEELQLHAMSALCILIPVLIQDYFFCHGSNRLLMFLEWCTDKKADYIGHGNSFHGKGGHGSKRAQLKYCLRVIRSIVSLGNEQAIQDLTDQGAIIILSKILNEYSQNKQHDNQIDVEIQSDILFILTCICENDLHRKELFGNEGVEILIALLKKKSELIWNGLGYQRLIIGTIDCIWATVIACIINEDSFIEKEGVFCLLDILEVTPKSMQNLILGCLLDLSDNPRTLTHMFQWEGKDNQKISHFLCNLWREEEKEIGVRRDENGAIVGKLIITNLHSTDKILKYNF